MYFENRIQVDIFIVFLLAVQILCTDLNSYYGYEVTYQVEETNPGVQLRLTKPGLDYVGKIGSAVLNDIIPTFPIPDQDVPISGGSISVTNMKLVEFNSPSLVYSFKPPRVTNWGVTGGYADVHGHFTFKYGLIKGTGKFAAKVTGIEFNMDAYTLKRDDGEPRIVAGNCSADIDDVSIKFWGGFLPWVINIFRSPIASSIKSQLRKVICLQLTNGLNDYVNTFLLANLPLVQTFYKSQKGNLAIDMLLNKNPTASKDYVESYHNGRIFIDGNTIAPQFQPIVMDVSNASNMMSYGFISDYTLKTMLTSTFNAEWFKGSISGQTHKYADYLKTNCKVSCLGALFEGLGEKFPDSEASLDFSATNAPVFLFQTGKAIFFARGQARFYLPPNGNRSEVYNISFINITLQCELHDVRWVNNTIYGRFEVITFRIVPFNSKFKVDESKLFITQLSLSVVVAELVNAQTEVAGVSVPIFDGLRVTNSTFQFFNDTLLVGVDFQYKNY